MPRTRVPIYHPKPADFQAAAAHGPRQLSSIRHPLSVRSGAVEKRLAFVAKTPRLQENPNVDSREFLTESDTLYDLLWRCPRPRHTWATAAEHQSMPQ